MQESESEEEEAPSLPRGRQKGPPVEEVTSDEDDESEEEGVNTDAALVVAFVYPLAECTTACSG